MGKQICIHGHFYQPQRKDPWFGEVFPEASAAPKRHWNERITRESYAPLAWSRRLDAGGKIADLVNCYEWMSFNIGPTLFSWLEREEPDLLARIQEADRLSLARWGHGNAMAQIFHHIIMPLATNMEKEVEIAWALEDFEFRFQRQAEGLWLSECAADISTLEAVAARGIKFVLLSPHQARAVCFSGDKAETPVHGHSLDVGRPYWVDLPSGRKIAAFFYQADLAQQVAFEGLLRDGEQFWQKISAAAALLPGEKALLTLATDGETYGHHFTFGEMALAYALAQGYSGRNALELTNFGAYLAANPPEARVILHDPSSWSCAHGVERWRSDCGCTTGGHAGWNQAWRGPLRKALDTMKKQVDGHYFSQGADLFHDAGAALLDYGQVLARPSGSAAFLRQHLREGASVRRAAQLLSMQENACAAYTSCAWFFDDLSRIEPVNSMRFALRAVDLMHASGGPDGRSALEEGLAGARSNKAEEGSGRDIFYRRVLPGRQDPAGICFFAYLRAWALNCLPDPGQETELCWPNLRVQLTPLEYNPEHCAGRAVVIFSGIEMKDVYLWNGRLPLPGGSGLDPEAVFWEEYFLEAREEAAGNRGTEVFCRRGAELAQPLRETVCLCRLEALLKSRREEELRTARLLVASLRPFEEGQTTCFAAPRWTAVAPYLPLAAYAGAVPKENLDIIRDLVQKHLAGSEACALAVELLEETVLEDLRLKRKPDAELRAAIKRTKAIFEAMDWWKAQNALWIQGRVDPEFRGTAEELGFYVD